MPGNIEVTPIPIEIPIHSRPVIQQSHQISALVNAAFPFTSANPSSGNSYHWGEASLLIFLVACLGLILSWSRIMERLRTLTNGRPLVREDEEPFGTETQRIYNDIREATAKP